MVKNSLADVTARATLERRHQPLNPLVDWFPESVAERPHLSNARGVGHHRNLYSNSLKMM